MKIFTKRIQNVLNKIAIGITHHFDDLQMPKYKFINTVYDNNKLREIYKHLMFMNIKLKEIEEIVINAMTLSEVKAIDLMEAVDVIALAYKRGKLKYAKRYGILFKGTQSKKKNYKLLLKAIKKWENS